ncbi:MAG: M23 family metallopeptidase [Deltaproteobacteria bacterium]|nr:M23 family metallopeptidase [Deltaproteobacteria bacterium]
MLSEFALARAGWRRSAAVAEARPPLLECFGIRSLDQLRRDYLEVARHALRRDRYTFGLSSYSLLRPELSVPTYLGFMRSDGLAPIYNLFDRHGGARHYSQRVTRRWQRDFRGGRLSYDEHNGTDLVCPIGTPLCAAAPGIVVLHRDRFLRGGMTVAVDHGHGVITQYTHCARAVAAVGQRVARGDTVALSGAAGIDLVNFVPLVPPHIHFMVWVDGVPSDPFLAAGEAPRPGIWLDGNDPRPSGPLAEDPAATPFSPVDREALWRVADGCRDDQINAEIDRCKSDLTQLAALIEDASFHDEFAFAAELRLQNLRGPLTDDRLAAAMQIRLTLPLPSAHYCGAYCADFRGSAPANGG